MLLVTLEHMHETLNNTSDKLLAHPQNVQA